VTDIASTLLTFSQVAIGLAGFSAILVALSGKPHQWTAVDAFRIRNILAFSFESVFLSLVPFVLTFFSLRSGRSRSGYSRWPPSAVSCRYSPACIECRAPIVRS